MAVDVAQLQIKVSTDAEKATAALVALEGASTKVEKATARQTAETLKLKNERGQFVSASAKAKMTEKELTEALERNVRAAKAAEQATEDYVGELNRLPRSGSNAFYGLAATARGADEAAEAAERTNHGMRNLGQQLNQVGQQGLATGNYMQALAIQLPDILGGMGSTAAVFAGMGVGLAAGLIPALMSTKEEVQEIAATDWSSFKSSMDEILSLEERYDEAIAARSLTQSAASNTAISLLGREIVLKKALFELEKAQLEQSIIQLRAQAEEANRVLQSRIDEELSYLDAGQDDSEGNAANPAAQMRLQVVEETLAAERDLVLQTREANLALDVAELTLDNIENAIRGGEQAMAGTASAAGNTALAVERQADAIGAAYQSYYESLAVSNAANAVGAERLTQLNEEAALAMLVLQHGEDSNEVADFRLGLERAQYEAELDTLGVSENKKVEMMAAWDAANGIAGAGMASNIAAAVTQAIALAKNLDDAARSALIVGAYNRASAAANSGWRENMGGRGAVQGGTAEDENGFSGPGAFAGTMTDEERRRFNGIMGGMTLDEVNAREADRAAAAAKKGKGGGGGKSAAEKAADEAKREEERLDKERRREALKWYEETRTATEEYNDELRELQTLNKLGYFDGHPEAYAKAVKSVGEAWRDAEFGDAIKEVEEFNNEIAGQIANAESLGEAWDGVVDAIENKFRSLGQTAISTGLDILASGIFPSAPGQGGWLSGATKGLLSSVGLGQAAGGAIATGATPGPGVTYEGGGYTGNGSRTGGVDGRGGYMAVVHPEETIIDHRKGGGSGGSSGVDVQVAVRMEKDGNLTAFVEGISERSAQRGIARYDRTAPDRVNSIQQDRRRR